ncbi:MAG: hypothetical protein IKU26_06790 [Clostridia bacterium]|nr:hypothetical protein [Clostridia bacterium]
MNCKRLLTMVLMFTMALSVVGSNTATSASSVSSSSSVSAGENAIQPDTWVAVDGLGRTISNYATVGEKQNDKVVGMFFHNFHDYFSAQKPRNVSQIIAQYPEARNDFDHPAWENTGDWSVYVWNEPLWGYYKTTDRYVLRKQAELFADAGVDVLIFDLTNGRETFSNTYSAIFEVFEQAIADGVDVPQIAFFLNPYLNDADGQNMVTQLKSLYKSIYSKKKSANLWFYWEGKPLIIAREELLDHDGGIEQEMKEFFTFRKAYMTYWVDQTSFEDSLWGYLSVYPQTKFGVRKDGSVEYMTVSPARNADKTYTYDGTDPYGGIIAMNDYLNRSQGRGYVKGNYSYSYTYKNSQITINSDTKDAYVYGLGFQQQWDYALETNPDFILVTGWNELLAQRRQEWQGSENGFPDNFNDEYSRDIEPSKGILKDHFYYQLVDNIRKFKGVGKPETASADKNVSKTIDINSLKDQWADVGLSFNHYTGSTVARNSSGWSGLVYKYDTMRNDIVTSKVAYDEHNIYFMVETKNKLTASSDKAWMRLLIDTDSTGVSPNWEGFEYVINRVSPSGNDVVIEKSTGGWNFEKVGTGKFSVSGNRLQIAVPRSALGLTDLNKLSFNFKWADNTIDPTTQKDSGDIMDYYLYGDVAPGGRFMFAFNTETVSMDPNVPTQTETPAQTEAPTQTEVPTQNDASQNAGLPAYVWWVVGIGAALLVAMGIALAIFMKKKN